MSIELTYDSVFDTALIKIEGTADDITYEIIQNGSSLLYSFNAPSDGQQSVAFGQ